MSLVVGSLTLKWSYFLPYSSYLIKIAKFSKRNFANIICQAFFVSDRKDLYLKQSFISGTLRGHVKPFPLQASGCEIGKGTGKFIITPWTSVSTDVIAFAVTSIINV